MNDEHLKTDFELLTKPGDTILETIDFLKISQTELADEMGIKPEEVKNLISGKMLITPFIAMQLEKALGIDMQFWINREFHYREKLQKLQGLD